jgi:hypothetical protein
MQDSTVQYSSSPPRCGSTGRGGGGGGGGGGRARFVEVGLFPVGTVGSLRHALGLKLQVVRLGFPQIRQRPQETGSRDGLRRVL